MVDRHAQPEILQSWGFEYIAQVQIGAQVEVVEQPARAVVLPREVLRLVICHRVEMGNAFRESQAHPPG